MLTPKQYELLSFIHRCLVADGISPSFDEMKEALQLKSKSGIHRLITGLEERGFIRRLRHRARALEIMRLPENVHTKPTKSNGEPGFEPTVIEGGFRAGFTGSVPAPTARSVELPLYGRIAAGSPIEALRDHSRSIDMPASLLGPGEHYCLEIAGDSMIEAGINDGDIAIIQRRDYAENGEIVVALLDEAEVTLKRLRRKGASVALEPANAAHETRIFGPDRVRVQGRLVGIFRKY